jgi:hypothetical protein
MMGNALEKTERKNIRSIVVLIYAKNEFTAEPVPMRDCAIPPSAARYRQTFDPINHISIQSPIDGGSGSATLSPISFFLCLQHRAKSTFQSRFSGLTSRKRAQILYVSASFPHALLHQIAC